MPWVGWLLLYLAALAFESAVLPELLGASVPSISGAVLIVGIVIQRFVPGFWFTVLAALIRDLLAPAAAPPHLASALVTFLAVHLFGALTQWDEPLRRIGGALVGIIARPVGLGVGAGLGRALFGSTLAAPGLADLASAAVRREAIFAALWWALFVWLTLRWFRRRRREEVSRLA